MLPGYWEPPHGGRALFLPIVLVILHGIDYYRCSMPSSHLVVLLRLEDQPIPPYILPLRVVVLSFLSARP